jgi:heme-degrading monooxygenase HmoA
MKNARFRSIIEFAVKQGREREFVEAFHAAGMLTRPKSIDGFVEAELMCAGSTFVVIACWHEAEAYAEWQAVSQREAPVDALNALAETIERVRQGRLFERMSLD